MNKLGFKISLILNVLLVVSGIYLFMMHHKPQKKEAVSPKSKINIVMLGNSITAAGNWTEVLERDDVFNGGQPGWTSQQLSWVIKDFIIPNEPVLCFFKAGINDYTLGISTERIYQNICTNMDSIKNCGTHPVYQTTLYQRYNEETNREIDKLNEMMFEFCAERAYDVVDLRDFLCENGDIKDEFVKDDNTHLKPEAYPVWAEAIKPIIEKYGL